jgi:hypothetical protein
LRLSRLKKRRLAVKDALFRHHPQASEFRAAAREVLTLLRGRKPAGARS